jgi:hypothetical protein
MIEILDSVKKQLGELATILNAFKSEAVQLRLLDFLLGTQPMKGLGFIQKPVRTAKRTRANRSDASAENGATPKKKKKAASGNGAPATLTHLLSTSFFDKPKTINDIVEHCKHGLARTFKANEFSGKLGRLVRSGELTRKKNGDNQYEYKKP